MFGVNKTLAVSCPKMRQIRWEEDDGEVMLVAHAQTQHWEGISRENPAVDRTQDQGRKGWTEVVSS